MLNRLFQSSGKQYDALNGFYRAYKKTFLTETEDLRLDRDTLLGIYQDSVVATYQKYGAKRIKRKNADLKSFLFGVCWSKIEEKLGNTSVAKKMAAPYTIIKLEDTILSAEQKELEKHFIALSENVQQIFKLYYYEHFSNTQIVAQTSNTDVKTVESLRKRGLKRLLSQIKK